MRSRLSPALLLIGLSLPAWSATTVVESSPLPEADEVIRRFVERATAATTNLATGVQIHYRTNITEKFDRKGRLDEREELLLRITTEGDSEAVELLQVDGRTPTDKERERSTRRFGGKPEEARKRDRPDRSRQLNAYLTLEVLSRYVFSVDGQEEVGGRPCFKVSFKPGTQLAKSDKMFERVLDRLTGIFWIDTQDYQLAQADIQLSESVPLWGGVLGGLEYLRLQIGRRRDAAGLWRDRIVEARFIGRAVARHIDVRTLDHSSAPVDQPPVVAAD